MRTLSYSTINDIFQGKENNLSLLRLVAALAVIYGHAYALSKHGGADLISMATGSYAFAGGVAVDLFFLISGFLITASVTRLTPKKFVLSRVLRIFPALWVNLLLVTFVLGLALTSLSPQDYLKNTETWNYFWTLATTRDGAFFLPGVFSDHRNAAINGSIWSVIIELRLYALTLILSLIGIFRKRIVFNLIFLTVLATALSNLVPIDKLLGNSTNSHVCLFYYIGSFIYVNRNKIPTAIYPFIISLLLATLLVNTSAFPVFYYLTLITFFNWFSFQNQFSWIEKYGDFSYGIYLYGWPMQQILIYFFPEITPLQNTFGASILAIFCGVLSWYLVEKPAIQLKNKNLFFLTLKKT